ncbi:unnamed protein product [Clavelina lepadiformis]|uniref:Uncharacterized protein n=1 Tax=Clavelina lepadiformis TaxID=159417 RepID=A0ABP0FI96_CLALP
MQSTSSKCGCRRSTNLNFGGWSRSPPSQPETQHFMQRNQSQRSKNRIYFENRPKLLRWFSRIQSMIHENPGIRPSICAVITGFVIIVFTLIVFAIPFVRRYLSSWVTLSLVAAGTIIVIGGVLGALKFIFLPKMLHKKRLQQKIAKKCDKKFPVGDSKGVSLRNDWSQHEATQVVGEESIFQNSQRFRQKENLFYSSPDDIMKSVSDLKGRRKLPGSPRTYEGKPLHSKLIIKSGSFSIKGHSSDKRQTKFFSPLSDSGNPLPLIKTSPVHVTRPKSPLCNSVPNLHATPSFDVDYNAEIEADAPEHELVHVPRSQASRPDHRLHSLIYERCSDSSQDDTKGNDFAKSLAEAKVNDLYDVYHDTLLLRGVTNLRFQCDREFRKAR